MGDMSPEVKQLLEHYNKGLELYRARKWDEAISEFKAALEAAPEGGPSQVYICRCADYKETPPPDDWDGVYVARTK